jgi:serine protease Do
MRLDGEILRRAHLRLVMEMTMETDHKSHRLPPRRSALGLCNATSRSKLKASLLAGVAATALVAATVHSIRADSPELKSATALVGAAQIAGQSAGFADLVASVKPAVVSVRVKTDMAPQLTAGDEEGQPFQGTPFEKFFREFGGKGMPWSNGNGQHKFVQGQGSGFFVSANGYIVTNHHVLDKAVKVEVVTDKGTTFDAKVIGTDRKTDLALLKVDAQQHFPYVELASAMPRVGEWVVAMGNPFGLDGTVTAGIVSAHGRNIGAGPYDDFLQIDAPVNKGNSGGPTFNIKGEVVGVNTAIFSPSGGSVGIAFAIPADTVNAVVEQLKSNGRVERGWLGVQIQGLSVDVAESLGLGNAAGALVTEAQPGSPAAKVGLKSGDVITGVGGAHVQDGRDLARKVAGIGPNKAVDLTFVRDGKEQKVSVKLGELKEQKAGKAAADKGGETGLGVLGLTIAPAAKVEGAGDQGLAVLGVEANSKAAEIGFQEGDLILKAGSKEVSRPADFKAAMSEAKTAGKKNMLVLLKRGGAMSYVAVPVAIG